MRALHAVLAVVLVVAPAAAAGPALTPLGADRASAPADGGSWSSTPADSVRPADTANRAVNETTLNRTTRVLALPAGMVTRSTLRAQYVDLGPGVAFSANASSARLRTLSVLRAVESAEGEQREQRLGAALTTVEERTSALRERQRAAIGAYGAGDLDQRALLVELARIDIAARELRYRQAELTAVADRSDDIELDQGRLATLERRIDVLTGPVRSHAVDVLRGNAESTRFYVATGPGSVTLTTLDNDTYVRESFRGDRYNPGEGTISPDAALDITAESYPVIWETRRNNTQVIGSDGIYLVEVPHTRGTLRAFVDGESRAVFKEDQRRSLATMNDYPARTATKDGLELSVNRTYPGGPTRVSLRDAETGAPVDANVTLSAGGQESELLGRTGSSGTLWTLSPGSQYTVTAIRGNDVVLLTLDPAAPPRTGEGEDGNTSGSTG
jgi:hypothetical protein